MKSIKVIGSAAALALVLAALVGATAASAAWFTPNAEGTKLEGKHTGTNTSLKLEGETWQCGEKAQFRNIPLSAASAELAVPAWSPGCIYVGLASLWKGEYTKEAEEEKKPVTCKYNFHAGTNNSMLGWVDITGCENGGQVLIAKS